MTNLIRNRAWMIAALAGSMVALSSCSPAKKQDAVTEAPAKVRFGDTCFDMPNLCGAVYSNDGKFMALVSPTETSAINQIYRVRLDDSSVKPEIVSIDSEGQPSGSDCEAPKFLGDNSLVFSCKGQLFQKSEDSPVALYAEVEDGS